MDTIKITVDVNVNLSESTQQFIAHLFMGAGTSIKASQVEAPKVEAPKTEAPKTEAPKVEAPKVEDTKAIGIEDVREALKNKVNEHRDTIKAKLQEFNAPSVTKLDPSKYDEMYNFLMAL